MATELDTLGTSFGGRANAACGCRALSVLLVGGNPGRMERLRQRLARHVGLAEFARDTTRADRLLPRCHYDVLVVDLGADGPVPARGWLDRWRHGRRVLASMDTPDAGQALEGVELIATPLRTDDLIAVLHRPRSLSATRSSASPAIPRERILVGQSESICAVRRLIDRVAALPATILLEGETGTGKELVARTIHDLSRRRGPFVPVNCGAIAPELIESEIFGHTKGAFTGAHQTREGLFVTARGGTLFLDEIGEMRADLQVKLLRTLEEGCVRPVGADREVSVDVRIIASTQPGIADKVADGGFREDLYYRLNVIHIQLPPLRNRRSDIPALASHFVATVASSMNLPAPSIDETEMQRLESYAWPGNVRELRNVVERAVLLGEWSQYDCCHSPGRGAHDSTTVYPLDWTLEQVKQHHIERVLEASHGNRSAAARKLGVSRKTLERKLGRAVRTGQAGDGSGH